VEVVVAAARHSGDVVIRSRRDGTVVAAYLSLINHLSITYQPPANHLPTTCQPPILQYPDLIESAWKARLIIHHQNTITW